MQYGLFWIANWCDRTVFEWFSGRLCTKKRRHSWIAYPRQPDFYHVSSFGCFYLPEILWFTWLKSVFCICESFDTKFDPFCDWIEQFIVSINIVKLLWLKTRLLRLHVQIQLIYLCVNYTNTSYTLPDFIAPFIFPPQIIYLNSTHPFLQQNIVNKQRIFPLFPAHYMNIRETETGYYANHLHV